MINEQTIKPEAQHAHCTGVHELIDWEIVQHRRAVDMHRLELSKKQGRCISWDDAEEDYSRYDSVSRGEQWRVEFCGMICKHRSSCLLALHFLQSKHTVALHKAG
ncbi:hypothetical protein [Pontiella sulfatireligans]|uniref:Uncharacterized protein n=1 Tax=Pontiella sulfatireligans TaxID=2750658 RepID=A0A6C2UIU3_9BACT|nr:hypothetical protein [Pontiella sulfatireligans]VGO20130.1 hypothetical protein SCARR_02191 [Pontiella sulfatireligans]